MSSLEEEKVYAKVQVNNKCEEHIITFYPIKQQISYSIGVYGAEKRLKMKLDLEKCISASNVAQQLIDSCSSIEELNLLAKVTWPEIGRINTDVKLTPEVKEEQRVMIEDKRVAKEAISILETIALDDKATAAKVRSNLISLTNIVKKTISSI
jgi:hypothetical protein